MGIKDNEAEVFRNALKGAKLKTTDGPEKFGVSRQTIANWRDGKTRIPKAAFVRLLEILGGKDDMIRYMIENYREEAVRRSREQRREKLEADTLAALNRLLAMPLAEKDEIREKISGGAYCAALLAEKVGLGQGTWSIDYLRGLAVLILECPYPVFALDRTGGKPAQYLCICKPGAIRDTIRGLVYKVLRAAQYLRKDEELPRDTVLFLS